MVSNGVPRVVIADDHPVVCVGVATLITAQGWEVCDTAADGEEAGFLKSRGTTAMLYGSRDVTRESFAQGLIAEGEEWMAMIESRNRTSHTYNEEIADQIADAILSRYVNEFEKLRETLSKLDRKEK